MTREEAIRIIETVFQDEYVYRYYDSITHQALDMAIEALSEPSIVRCKDCRWWSCTDSLYQHNSHLCRYWKSTNTSAEDFCSYGERGEK